MMEAQLARGVPKGGGAWDRVNSLHNSFRAMVRHVCYEDASISCTRG